MFSSDIRLLLPPAASPAPALVAAARLLTSTVPALPPTSELAVAAHWRPQHPQATATAQPAQHVHLRASLCATVRQLEMQP
jgi:hypothetical protein